MKKDICKNNSYYENLEKTFLKGSNNLNNNNLNKKEKYFLLTNIKKNLKQYFFDNNDEKKNQSCNQNLINSNKLNIKSSKNLNKIKSPMYPHPYPAFFLKNGINNKYNENNNGENNENHNHEKNLILQTQLFKENNDNINIRKNQTKSKTQIKYNKMKSNSEQIFLGKIKHLQKSAEKNEKDLNDNNKTIQASGRINKINKLLSGLNSASKSNKNYNQKFFLNKHIVIESKSKIMRGDSRKNNNSIILGNNDDNKNNINNCQKKSRLKELKTNNKINNFQKMYNDAKNSAKFCVLRNVFNNNDF